MSFINSLMWSGLTSLADKLGTDPVTLGFDIGKFFDNLSKNFKTWGSKLIAMLGVILVVWGIVNIVKAFISQGRGQTNWLMTAAMILVGGFLAAVSSWNNIKQFLDVGTKTIESMGK